MRIDRFLFVALAKPLENAFGTREERGQVAAL